MSKIKSSMIDQELRNTGLIMKIIPKLLFNKLGLRLLNKIQGNRKIKLKDETLLITEEQLTRKDGSKLRLCLFKPQQKTKNVPGVLWLHGGGYALGSPEQAIKIAKILNEASNCIIVAPDYRLSLQAPYPAALEDCYQTLLWMKNHSKELGIKSNQLMIGGDSAGGGLSAALSLYARDKGELAIAFQMPLYPMLDDRMISESARYSNTPVWNQKSNSVCWQLYLGYLFAAKEVPYYAAPARADNYQNLPPTATFVGDLEPFRDEVIAYVENLRKADVLVDFQLFKGCYHAFEQICPQAKVSKQAIAFLKNSFIKAVENYYAEQNKNN